MKENTLSRACGLMALLVIVFIGAWELYLRSTGIPLAYDDGKELWADQRAKVYDAPEKTTVFIGSSRIKYDLDIDTWKRITGREAVQLAIQGTSPMPILLDLGNDPKFHGKLVVDVTEPLFFASDPGVVRKPESFIAYYKKRTPAQNVSFAINHALESQFLFLDQDAFSLNAELDKSSRLTNRGGVYVFPDFPDDFDRCDFSRQSKMTDKFVADTALRHKVQNNWIFLMHAHGGGDDKSGGGGKPKENPVPIVIQSAVNAVSKIRARGGEVVFVRTPDSAPMPGGEASVFPRVAMWEPLLAATHSTGYYFTDNPATAHFVCPEWSHLKQSDAVLYTKALIDELPPSFAH